jgi:hypothetical protein
MKSKKRIRKELRDYEEINDMCKDLGIPRSTHDTKLIIHTLKWVLGEVEYVDWNVEPAMARANQLLKDRDML